MHSSADVRYRFAKITLPDTIVERETHAGVVVPHLAHGVLVEIEDTDTTVGIAVVEIGEDRRGKEIATDELISCDGDGGFRRILTRYLDSIVE